MFVPASKVIKSEEDGEIEEVGEVNWEKEKTKGAAAVSKSDDPFAFFRWLVKL